MKGLNSGAGVISEILAVKDRKQRQRKPIQAKALIRFLRSAIPFYLRFRAVIGR